jgi:isopentenyldiphosphate isomerase/intracellular septation protein A
VTRTDLIKKLLPGFIPLFVFILADEIWGTQVGIAVAVGVGVIELIVTGIKERRLEKFVLIDTALLVVLSLISILLDNDIFFKLKPALIELILCAVLGVSAFGKLNIVEMMAGRYMKDVSFNEQQKVQMQRNLRNMFWIFLAHTGLIVFSAFYMSKEAWVFISGGLFYLIFAAYFAFEWFRNKRMRVKMPVVADDEEWLPVVDESGKVIGKAPRSACHNGQKILHPVVHLHVFNPKGHIYLQKRPENKLVQPGKWDTAVGGHISFGESVETALKREAYEEIGLTDFQARPMASYKWETEVEAELVYSYLSYDYKKIRLHSEEVTEGKFWSRAQIEKNLGKDVFTPNFEFEFKMMNQLRDQNSALA